MSPNTLIDVSPGSSAQSAAAPPVTSGRASSAGPLSRAACSAARTSGSSVSVVTALRATTPDEVPAPPSIVAITVTERDRMMPLVVRVLLAHRRFAL
jgi:hypothetical protein